MELTPYQPGDDEWIEPMLAEAPEHVRINLVDMVRNCPEQARMAVLAERLVGVGVHSAKMPGDLATLSIYVAESYRRLGIGGRLLAALEADIRAKGITSVSAEVDRGSIGAGFAKKRGYALKVASCLMRYKGQPVEPGIRFIGYEDSMYERVQGVISRAYVAQRKRMNAQPYYMPASEAARQDMAAHAEDYFVHMADGKIVAVGYAAGGQLDSLCVEEAYRGQGLGKALVAHGIAKLRREGYAEPALWVIESNEGARRLYENMGFEIVRVQEVWVNALDGSSRA